MNQTTKVISRVGVGLGSATLVAFAFGYVQTRIRVESNDGRRHVRRIDNLDGNTRDQDRISRVRLVRKLSDAPCIEGRTWGFNRNQIWVDRGCRAEFEITTTDNWNNGRGNGRWDNGRGNGRWDDRRDDRRNRRNDDRWDDRWDDRNTTRREVRVESEDGRRREIRVDTTGGVRLVRRLSDAACVQGRTWGYDRDSIWVSRGCRAVFEVRASRTWDRR